MTIRKYQTIFISKKQEIAIITGYPWWMKWLMKYVELHIIPDVNNNKMIYETTFPCISNKQEILKYKKMHKNFISFITKISDVT